MLIDDITTTESYFPVSPAQSRLLILDRVFPASAQYNVHVAAEVHGPFDVAAFADALSAVVARHEALRTTFRTVDGVDQQVVRSAWPVVVREEHGVARSRVGALMQAEAARPFDLAAGPLLRAAVFHVEDGSAGVVLTIHHLVCDGWSVQLVLNELAGFYRAAVGGGPYRPARPGLQAADVAAWQNGLLAAGEYDAALDRWARQLKGAPAVLPLPTDRPRPPVRTAAGATEWIDLPGTVLDQVNALARDCRATAFMVMLSAYAAFLGRLTGQTDIVIGAPVSGRNQADLLTTVGMINNTVALRVDLSGDPSIREVVSRVRNLVLDVQDIQDVPFDAVVRRLAPARETSHDPVFQVAFGYDDDNEQELRLHGTETKRVPLAPDIAKFDFSMFVERSGPGLRARVEFRTDLLDRGTVQRWAGNFRTLLDGVLARPDLPVRLVDVVTPAEHDEVVHGWNPAVRLPSEPAGPAVPDLIAEQAARHPDHTAVVCGDERLTYRELLVRADALAAELRRHGAGRESRVVILVPRSADMVVAAVAVLRAGAAYVPVDTTVPAARVDHVVSDCSARLVLAAASTAAVAAATGATVVRVDRPLPAADTPAPAVEIRPRDAAYVVYTSGSTGTAKGVVVEHHSLTTLATDVSRTMPKAVGDRVLNMVSFAFDAAVADLFFTLVSGAELHIARDDERYGDALFDLMRRSRINSTITTPSILRTVSGDPAALPHLKTLLVGGEAVPAELVDRWAPGRRFFNVYGPTECTVITVTAELAAGDSPVIGAPVPGTGAYVLDERLRPVPVGVPGELYLVGAGVGRGYLGRQALTAERFVADPHARSAGSRMYRTGDLARYDATGQITCLGRVDDQVKHRGFRIELGEIEVVLATHPRVSSAAVTIHRDDPDAADGRLIGYVTGPAELAAADGSLRRWLADRLPAYLVPEMFVVVDALPLSASGKLDRKRLPAPPARRVAGPVRGRSPRTATEQQIARIWADQLRLDRVGIDDNFFDLGGTSAELLAVLAALRELQGAIPLQLVDLFRHPTVAALAEHLTRAGADRPDERGRTRGLRRHRQIARLADKRRTDR